MKRAGPKTRVREARKRVADAIERATDPNNRFARGLAREGYLGGYEQALSDVLLVLNGLTPNDARVRRFWQEGEDA